MVNEPNTEMKTTTPEDAAETAAVDPVSVEGLVVAPEEHPESVSTEDSVVAESTESQAAATETAVAEPAAVELAAVSYTHLDVYKRQGLFASGPPWPGRFRFPRAKGDCRKV